MKLHNRITAVLLVCTAVCGVLTGCTNGSDGQNSTADGLWFGIEPAQEDEFGKVTYEDGLYLSQTVKEPLPDLYEKDTKQQKTVNEDGVRYALYEKHAEIIGHDKSFSADALVIPAEVEGLPVTKIADVKTSDESVFDIDKLGAFYGCYTLASVTIPEGMHSIGNYAFYGCKNLREVELPETVMHIGDRTFAMCSSLKKLTVPSGIDTVGDSAFSLTPWYDDLLYHRDLIIFNGRLYDAGRRCTGRITVPDYVISVGAYAFYSCSGLESVILPESVQSVGEYAFCDCPDLHSILFLNPECRICSDASTVSNKRTGGDKDFYKGIIYGEAGSTAEKFAKKRKFRFESTEEFFERQKNQMKQNASEHPAENDALSDTAALPEDDAEE